MSEELIKEITNFSFDDKIEQAPKALISLLSKDWIKGLTALKRSRILINKFGGKKAGERIAKIIDFLSKSVPSKYRNRYKKYFESITPLNSLLEELSEGIIKSVFWKLDKEVCLTSLLARFEAVYAHMENNAKTLLDANMKDKKELYLGSPIFLRTDDGTLIAIDRKLQQLGASLDRSLRFIEYYLKRIPAANIENSLDTYKAGTFQLAGELWNSIFYLVDKVSLFDWYATEISNSPKTLYYQPKNKNEHILKIVGELRESQWLLQQSMDTEEQFKSMSNHIRSDDPLMPRNEKELRAYIELSELCHDNKILEVEFKNGLRVKEYIRAWFVISEIAVQHFAAKKCEIIEKDDKIDISNLLIQSADTLIALLSEKGKLTHAYASKSIDLLTYWNMDHDIFSSPLFPTNEGNYLILTSIFLSGNPVRSVFRLLSHDEIDISFKGMSSEKELEKIFTRMGFACLTGYKFDDESGEGDIDCIAYKEGTFIICESKNIVPNESNYDRYRTMELFTNKASQQANRASRFVREHLSQICEKLSVKIANSDDVRIFPVIITNLFEFTGMVINGVPICDFSALGKFATAKYVYRTKKGKEGITKEPVKELYRGEVPTAKELLCQIQNPFQIEHQAKKLMVTSITQPMTKNLTLKVFDVRESDKEIGDASAF